MNILPKKRWHVRTRENIARVRKDEAKAAEEEKQKQLRIEKAEKEARLEVLRKKARLHYKSTSEQQKDSSEVSQKSGHINLFYELENEFVVNKPNPEYEKEKKLETEKYEKQIGYLTYLGQDTNEITGNVSWYNKDPKERKSVIEEVAKEAKVLEDPLRDIRKYLGSKGIQKINKNDKPVKVECNKSEGAADNSLSDYIFLTDYKKLSKKKKKNKKRKKKKKKYSSDSDSSDSHAAEKKKKKAKLEKLRAERIKREMEERKRAQAHLRSLKGEKVNEEKANEEIEQKYSSQFNPHLARQNIIKR